MPPEIRWSPDVAVKLPEADVARLLNKDGIEPFEPYGKRMREWVLLSARTKKDVIRHRKHIEAAAKHVSASS